MRINIENDQGETAVFDIPFDASEITYADFVDFQVNVQKMYKALEEDEAADVSEYLEEATFSLVEVVSGTTDFLPFGLDEDVSELIEQDYSIRLGDKLTLVRLYAHVTNLIEAFQPLTVDYRFETNYKGENYYISPNKTARMLGLRKAYTMGEVFDYNEFTRQFSNQIEKKGDLDGNLSFTLTMYQMAILLRKEGEKIPFKKSDRKTFYSERARHLAELPLGVVLSVRFFFTSIIMRCARTATTDTSSSQKSGTTTVTSSNRTRKGRQMKGRRKNYVAHLILQDGTFTIP